MKTAKEVVEMTDVEKSIALSQEAMREYNAQMDSYRKIVSDAIEEAAKLGKYSVDIGEIPFFERKRIINELISKGFYASTNVYTQDPKYKSKLSVRWYPVVKNEPSAHEKMNASMPWVILTIMLVWGTWIFSN